jgi:drug/metabolite transporter (DMT)-like permease
MSVAALLTPLSDALAKTLGENHFVSATAIALVRFALQTIFMFPLMLVLGGWQAFQINRPVLNILRGALLAGGSVSFFAALKYMALADAIAIFFAQPLLAVLLSAVFLREFPNRQSIIAVVLGFVGALIVIQPNIMAFGVIALLPLACATSIAVYFLLGRYLSLGNSSIAMHFYTGIGALITLLIFVLNSLWFSSFPIEISIPSSIEVWMLLLLMSFLASLVHLMYIQAYRRAPASLLAPFNYLEIISAAAIEIIFFRDVPGLPNTIGIIIIVASGLLLAWKDSGIARKNSES